MSMNSKNCSQLCCVWKLGISFYTKLLIYNIWKRSNTTDRIVSIEVLLSTYIVYSSNVCHEDSFK